MTPPLTASPRQGLFLFRVSHGGGEGPFQGGHGGLA